MRLDYVNITGMSIASAQGRCLESLGRSILQEQRALTFSHRYASSIKAPLGSLKLEEWDIAPELSLLSDQVMRRVLQSTLEKLAFETRVFDRYQPEDIGFFLGTTSSGVDGFFSALNAQRQSAEPLNHFLSPNMQQIWIAHQMRDLFPFRGPFFTFSSSCAAAAQAIGQAFDAVRSGFCKVAIAGGIDILNAVTLHGFNALQILDEDFCRPFSPERKGINLGEGGALFLLENQSSLPTLARIHGYAALSEAHHMVQPAPEGIWMKATMERALKNAGWNPASIDYINAHGTGTQGNDAAESLAIHSLFGGHERLHASKALTGHYLGAAGALEAAITIAMLRNYPEWAKQKGLATHHRSELRGLSNSFGFGGSNVSLLFSTGHV